MEENKKKQISMTMPGTTLVVVLNALDYNSLLLNL
jgi:hypothetical protein